MRMILLYYNCTFALFIYRLHMPTAYAHYTSFLFFSFVALFEVQVQVVRVLRTALKIAA